MKNLLIVKSQIARFNGTQVKLRLQCSRKGCTWTQTIMFPKKVTNFNNNLCETYLTMFEQLETILALPIGGNMFSKLYRDDEDGKMIITRLA